MHGGTRTSGSSGAISVPTATAVDVTSVADPQPSAQTSNTTASATTASRPDDSGAQAT